MRTVDFENNQFYHVYNRGIDKRDIFTNDSDYERILAILTYCNNQSTDSERTFIKNHIDGTNSKLSFEAQL